MYYFSNFESPIGRLLLVCTDESLVGLWLHGQKYFAAGMDINTNALPQTGQHRVLINTQEWLKRYFAGEAPCPTELPLEPAGTAFQKKVWHALLEIPHGQLTTYGDLAKKLSCRSARAVGAAVGRNPISIIIPCHRVVGAGGKLTGYAGGLEAKKALLAVEDKRD